jgi:hypothetical protein
MITFYEFYYEKQLLQPLVAKVAWASNIVIIEKCKSDLHKEF